MDYETSPRACAPPPLPVSRQLRRRVRPLRVRHDQAPSLSSTSKATIRTAKKRITKKKIKKSDDDCKRHGKVHKHQRRKAPKVPATLDSDSVCQRCGSLNKLFLEIVDTPERHQQRLFEVRRELRLEAMRLSGERARLRRAATLLERKDYLLCRREVLLQQSYS